MELNNDMTQGALPALIPDVVVARMPGGRWRIEELSARLAQLAGARSAAWLHELFSESVPSLEDLAQEVLDADSPLTAIPIRLSAAQEKKLVVDALPGGISSDYQGRTVIFRFREASSEPVPEERMFSGMVGDSPAIREVFRKISLYAPSDASVVITGETGSGKELVARALHDCSSRKDAPYVAVNCTAISEELLESELFGHEKGAFTGAVRMHRGRFERADGGTLFLDEIGDMPLQTQAKLLRVLEQGTIERVGAEREQKVDVRVLCATNVPLEKAVAQRRFRADLYHRLSVLRIHIAPLRDRLEDIPLLVARFLKQLSVKYGRTVERLTPEAISLLQSYLWPGNVRELRNVLERVFVENQASVIGARAFREWVDERQGFASGEWDESAPSGRAVSRPLIPPYPLPSEQTLLPSPSGQVLEAEVLTAARPHATTRPVNLDREQLVEAFRRAEGNLSEAARLLGVHRATLYRTMRRLGLSRRDLES